MYKIEYNKEEQNRNKTFGIIKSITIDSSDIMMMKYVDTLRNGNRNLVSLYLKYLKYLKHNHKEIDTKERFTIMNDKPENEKIIASILDAGWLINEDSLTLSKEYLDSRKKDYLKEIDFLKDSPKVNDQQQILLMQYFIDTFNNNVIEEKEFVKS